MGRAQRKLRERDEVRVVIAAAVNEKITVAAVAERVISIHSTAAVELR